MKNKLLLIVCLQAIFLQGCTFYKKPNVPAVNAPHRFKYARDKVSIPYKSKIEAQWWKNFGDQRLNRLVEKSFKNNYSYLITIKNIDIARTYVTQNSSMLWPQFNLNGNSSRNHSINIFNSPTTLNGSNGSNSGLPGLGRIYNFEQLFASVSYELDVWNQLGNAVNQSKADVEASIAASSVVKLSLLNSVVDSYFQLLTLNANIANLKNQQQAALEILRLMRAQYRGGLIDGAGLDDAKNQVDMIQITLDGLKKQREMTRNTLAYLLGEYPENFEPGLAGSVKNLNYLRLVPAELPSQMLSDRPDIQQAIYQVLSAGYVEKINYANFFPTFDITGAYGYASRMLANLLSGRNTFWNIGLNAVQPVFDYKLRSSEYARAKLQYENSILNYKNIVINAFKEVDTALSSYQQDTLALHAYQNQYRNTANKLSLTRAQYRGGLIDYTAYLVIKLNYLQTAYNKNNQQLLVVEDILQVYKTLGLGL